MKSIKIEVIHHLDNETRNVKIISSLAKVTVKTRAKFPDFNLAWLPCYESEVVSIFLIY
jgi:hypothetical protein